jgi:hypothetical protein
VWPEHTDCGCKAWAGGTGSEQRLSIDYAAAIGLVGRAKTSRRNPLISLELALVANSLCRVQEKRIRHTSENSKLEIPIKRVMLGASMITFANPATSIKTLSY